MAFVVVGIDYLVSLECRVSRGFQVDRVYCGVAVAQHHNEPSEVGAMQCAPLVSVNSLGACDDARCPECCGDLSRVANHQRIGQTDTAGR